MLDNYEIILRLVLATIVGGIIGVEREVSNKPAGLRTHVLISLGATLIMLVSIDAFHDPLGGKGLSDPARLAAQVVSGVGFLGAGTILRTGNRIEGLTTAAGLWVSAGIGLAIGSGYYVGGISTFVLVLMTLEVLNRIEKKLFTSKFRTLRVRAEDRIKLIGDISSILGDNDITISQINMKTEDCEFGSGVDILAVNLSVKLPQGLRVDEVFHEMREVAGLREIYFEGKIDGRNYSWSKS